MSGKRVDFGTQIDYVGEGALTKVEDYYFEEGAQEETLVEQATSTIWLPHDINNYYDMNN
jgi:hypothetical protein